MMVDFTIAIPTYNGASRLPKVLERLRSQFHTEQFSWEVVVVDNNIRFFLLSLEIFLVED